MQNEELSQLHGVLEAQADVLSELLVVARRQQQALVGRDRAAVEATTREQDELFAALQALEYDRTQLQQQLSAGDNEMDEPGLGFERLLRTLPESLSQTLVGARDEARTLLLELSGVNRTNQQLLAQELVMFDLYMSVLNPDMSAEVYSEPGQARRATGSAAVAFDARV